MSGVALFGKLPAHGDFVARGLGQRQREEIDAWLSASLAEARARLGEAFADQFDVALPWCCRGAGVAGAIAGSQDSLGRRFPILLMIADPDAAPRCERLLYAAIGERWPADRLIAEAGDAAEPVIVDAATRWWHADADATAELTGSRPPTLLTAMLARPVTA